MSSERQTASKHGHGGPREGAGRTPYTIEGLLKKMTPAEAAKFRDQLRRYALRLLIRRARAELREAE
jgi:hypothetical protein